MTNDKWRMANDKCLPPHFARGLGHQPQLRFLISFGQQIALHRRREPALRAYREPLQRHKSGSFLDAALQLALAFGFGLLRADQSEHYGAVFRHLGQRFETARALVIEFEQEAVEARLAKDYSNRAVISPRVKLALIVAPAQVQAERDPGPACRPGRRMIADDGVVHFDREIEQSVRVVAALAVAFAQVGVEQRRVLRRIDLNVDAAQPDQLLDFAAQDVDEVGQISVNSRVSARRLFGVVIGGGLLRADERGLGEARRLRAQPGILLRAHLPLGPQLGANYRALLNHLFALFVAERDRPPAVFVVPVEGVDQVAVKGVAPHLAVGDDFDAGAVLQLDGFGHGAVLALFERRIRKLPRFVAPARLFQIGRPQQAPDYIASVHVRFLPSVTEAQTVQFAPL